MLIPQPTHIDFETWRARVIEEYAGLGIPRDLPWKEFGMRLLNYPSIPPIPRVDSFHDWREWAERCMHFFM